MADRSRFTRFLLTAGSFIGGAAIGLLLAPRSGKENRSWIRENASGLTVRSDIWGRDALRTFRDRLKSELRYNVPDLYEATEFIDLELE